MAEHILHDYHAYLPGGVRLIPSSGGVFEIKLGRTNLFSKKKTKRFPEENEVEHKLAALVGAPPA